MICRVALHEKTPGSVASDEARGFRQWLKAQPGGTKGAYPSGRAGGDHDGS
jgi:hypothetical protein